jgi:hypothetical protein
MNQYANTQWQPGQYVVRIVHGSGDGRSYGGGEIYHSPATKPGWANSDQTTDWFVFDFLPGAQAKVEWANEYYDGSDYR